MSDWRGGSPWKRRRIAMLSSSARLAMLPTVISAERPLRPVMASLGTPHSGARRGNSMNSTTMMGAPSNAMRAAVPAASRNGGLPTGMWVFTRAVSSPHTATSMAAAVSSDCEKKKLVSIVKKLRKNTTKASRRARSSSVLSVSSTTSSVTPASRPSTVRWVSSVAPTATTSPTSRVQRPGRGRADHARWPRQTSTAAAIRLHHHGRLATCGSSTQAITTSRNSVSRASRGRWRRRSSIVVRTRMRAPALRGSAACGPRR